MDWSHEKIKGLSSKEYLENRKEIKEYYKSIGYISKIYIERFDKTSFGSPSRNLRNGKTLICRICKQEKTLDKFPNHKECTYGKDTRCKDCRAIYLKKYHAEHREEILESRKEYHEKYRKQNREAIRKRQKKYKKSLRGRLIENIRKGIRQYLYRKKLGLKVRNITKEDLGCSIKFLFKYLESQFKPGMTWENYGEWEVDHIFPISKIDLTNEEEIKKVCHYTNLQPLWGNENASKGNKILG